MNITDDKQKRALLLYQAGQATQEIFETLSDTGEDYDTAQAKLDEYFSPKKNVDFEIFQFRQASQQPGETVEQFATRLRKLAATCEFHDVNKEIKASIIQHCQSKRLRRYALREAALTLDGLLAKARSLEASEVQAAGMEQKLGQLEEVNHLTQQFRRMGRGPKQGQGTSPGTGTCRKCGLAWPHRVKPCPAEGKTCRACGKLNHFAKMCLSKDKLHHQPTNRKQASVNQLTVTDPAVLSSSSDDEYLYTMGQDKLHKVPKVKVKINDVEVEMIVDTGASTDVIDEVTFRCINHHNNVILQPTIKRLFAYGSSQLSVLGQFTADIVFQHSRATVPICIIQGRLWLTS